MRWPTAAMASAITGRLLFLLPLSVHGDTALAASSAAAAAAAATARQLQQTGNCFYPDGTLSSDHPCQPDLADGEPSACCGGSLGTVCLTNHLCRSGDGNQIRGSCTAQDWSGCPNSYCLGASTGGTDLISCQNVTRDGTDYCCDHTVDCCDSGVGRFEVLPAEPGTLAVWDESATQFSVVSSAPTSSSIVGTPTGSASSSSSAAGTITTGASATTSPSSATHLPPVSSPSPQPSQNNGGETTSQQESSGGLSQGATIGIAVGVSLGTLMLIAMAYIIWRLRRTDRLLLEEREKHQQQQQQQHQGAQGHPPPTMSTSTTTEAGGGEPSEMGDSSNNSDAAWKGYYAPQPPPPPSELDPNATMTPKELDGRSLVLPELSAGEERARRAPGAR